MVHMYTDLKEERDRDRECNKEKDEDDRKSLWDKKGRWPTGNRIKYQE